MTSSAENQINLMASLRGLMLKFGWGRHLQFVCLFFLILVVAVAEVASIGSVIPLMGILVNPEFLNDFPLAKLMFDEISLFFGISHNILILLIFVSFVLVAGATRLALSIFQVRLGHGIGYEMASSIYTTVLYQPYTARLNISSSEIITVITNKIDEVISNVIMGLIAILTSATIILSVVVALLLIETKMTIIIFLGFALIYLFIVFGLKSRLVRNGELVNLQRSFIVKILSEGMGGIKDILVSSSQKPFIDVYNASNFKLRRSIGNVQIINRFPRYIVETMGTSLLAIVVFFSTEEGGNFVDILPFLGALALASQRLLPLFQQLYAGVTEVLAAMPALDSVLTNLNQDVLETSDKRDYPILEFSEQIEFRDICFNYTSSDKPIIKGVSFNIKKGERIGLIGPTGCGKTTLIDIFMGLLEPSSGDILLDGVKLHRENMPGLQRRISHVPQDVFLSDASIAANVAFGVSENEIDYNRVREAIQKAQLSSTIDSMHKGLMTEVGEQGIRLSGGQRQRIGIARALYRDADIFVFDEATSALDQNTEKAVMDVIDGLSSDITMIMIAHRVNSLETCDRIIKLQEGEIISIDNVKNV